MKIWVDADACPVVIREILFKAATRTKTETILVANKKISTPRSGHIRFLLASAGPDEADRIIAENIAEGDLAITADIPLAADVVAKGGTAIHPRGELYTTENIQERLSARDFMDSLRSAGVETGGPSAMTKRDRQMFANTLDRLLQKQR